jgi:5'-nucleotidase (lipoprotein e(P4) family)
MYFRAVLLFLTAALAGCQTSPQNTPSAADETSQEYLEAAVLFVQTAAEYRALCYQAYNAGERQLRAIADTASTTENLAVVLDLDETVLDNSPYTAWQIEANLPYSKETWAQWTDQAAADLVPGVQRFLNVADSLGFGIFYISNRDTSALNATWKNMGIYGLPQIEPDHFYLKSTTSDKTERRDAVRDRGYEIVLFAGDNLGDYDARWDKAATADRNAAADAARDDFGTKFLMLPGPLYGSWLASLYNYNWSLTEAQRDSLRNAAMTVAEMNK